MSALPFIPLCQDGGRRRPFSGHPLRSLLVALSTCAAVFTGDIAAAEETANAADSPRIYPFSLGIPEDCFDSSAKALNSGAYPGDLTVVAAANCAGGLYLPFSWHNGGWSPVALPEARCGSFPQNVGYPDSVSDDHPGEPALTLQLVCNNHNQGWVKVADREITELPVFENRHRVTRTVVSSSGTHIVGGSQTDSRSASSAVRWTRTAEAWSAPQEITTGEATAVTDDGSVIVGNQHLETFCRSNGNPWVWTEAPGGGGELTMLDPTATALDITHDGSIIVGCRHLACTSRPNCRYPVPVYWSMEAGQWVMHDLQALDGVDSVAQAVAMVGDQPVIVGYGYTNQEGGILRPVIWQAAGDGSFGAPLRLEPIGGHFASWAEAVDVNRNGMVLGVSDAWLWEDGKAFPPTVATLWNVKNDFSINAGLNDAWYNPATPGQGFFVNVFPDIGQMFVAWFTYDTERPEGTTATLADPGHRWLTAFGPYSGSRAELAIEVTTGGVFDTGEPAPSQHLDGLFSISFSSCSAGLVHYEVPSLGLQAEIPIRRIVPDNVAACEALASGTADPQMAEAPGEVEVTGAAINRGMNDAWYNPATVGQGFFMNVFPGLGQMFLAWFTYETERPTPPVQAHLGDPGHRWLTAFGPFSGNRAELEIEVTMGGVFDAPLPQPTQHEDGSVVVEMTDCSSGTISYDIPSIGRQGVIPIKRIVPDNVPACEALAGQ